MESGTFVSQDYIRGRHIRIVEQDSLEPWVTYIVYCYTNGNKYIRKFYANRPVGMLYRLPRNWGGANQL